MALAKRKYAHFMNIEEEGLLQDNSGIILQRFVRMNPLKPLRILYPTGPGSSPRLRLNLMLLAAADALFYGVGMGGVAVIILYAQKTFDWQNYEVCFLLPIEILIYARRNGLTSFLYSHRCFFRQRAL